MGLIEPRFKLGEPVIVVEMGEKSVECEICTDGEVEIKGSTFCCPNCEGIGEVTVSTWQIEEYRVLEILVFTGDGLLPQIVYRVEDEYNYTYLFPSSRVFKDEESAEKCAERYNKENYSADIDDLENSDGFTITCGRELG